jgi:uroporphyrinogen-III synthase
LDGPPDPIRALEGIGVLVTRPRGRGERLGRRIEELGGRAWWLPTLEIRPPRDTLALNGALAQLAGCQWVVFVSPTAVEWGWNAISERGGLPAGVRVAAVGQGSARELAARGVTDVLAPAGKADSESLLALPELESVAGQRVLMFRGEGGRELLAETLSARGAQLLHAVCYRRVRPEVDTAPVEAAWERGEIRAVTVFSRESLDALVTMLSRPGVERLRRTPLFAPHGRIAEYARVLGVEQARTTPPGEDGLVAGLQEYFGHGSA